MAGRRSRLFFAVASVLLATPLLAVQEPTYWIRLDVPVVQDSIAYPRAVTSDPHTGEIFVCDTRRNRIVIFDQEALFSYQIQGGDSFTAPIDAAVDPEGYLLVVANHQGRRTLVELDFDGLFRSEVRLVGLPEGATEPKLMSVAISPDGLRLYLLDTANLVLWIAQRNGRIDKGVDLAAELSEKERKDLILGKVDVYGEQLLVAAAMYGQIWLFDLEGNSQGRTGTKGTGPCRLAFPTAAAMDENGDLIVVDQQRMFLLGWSPRENRCLAEYFGPGTRPGLFYAPVDISLDESGRLFVVQGWDGRVQAFEGFAPALSVRESIPESVSSVAEAETAVVGLPVTEEPVAGEPVAEEAVAAAPTIPQPTVTEEDRAAQGDTIAAGARESVRRSPRYETSYYEIAYPGGDLPPDRGAAVDVVIRAFRQAGVDLQQAVHEDIRAAGSAYGVNEPDPNIEHRRIRNLTTFFERHALSLGTGQDADWQPGDLVFWDRNVDGIPGHLGILSDEPGSDGGLRVIHHHRPDTEFSGRPSDDDVLFRWPVIAHYRWPGQD